MVEAKRTRRDAVVGQQQAKLYADCLETTYGQRPVIFGTNGYEHWIWDDLRYPPRPVQGFYTKDELALVVARRSSRVPLARMEINPQIAGRHYQVRTIRAIDEAFERESQRGALVAMATGAGKTRTVIALVDQLMRANWTKRVLFLVGPRQVRPGPPGHEHFGRHDTTRTVLPQEGVSNTPWALSSMMAVLFALWYRTVRGIPLDGSHERWPRRPHRGRPFCRCRPRLDRRCPSSSRRS